MDYRRRIILLLSYPADVSSIAEFFARFGGESIMFMFKKIVAPFFYPLAICFEVLLVGVLLLWFKRRQKLGKILVSIGIGLLVLSGISVTPSILLRPLEYKYDAILDTREIADVKWIVVLGGGHVSDPRLPSGSQLNAPSLVRLVEGIRLHRMLPGSKLLLSGGTVYDPVTNAQVMAEAAFALGVKEENMVLESLSKDTKDEARLVGEMVGDTRFILVTSASHMPRSMALFKKLGMQPVPAPTDYHVKRPLKFRLHLPSGNNAHKTQIAIHEYMGLIWAKMRGQM